VGHLYADKQQASTVVDHMIHSEMLRYADAGHVVVCEDLHVDHENMGSSGHCKVSTGPWQHFPHSTCTEEKVTL